MLLHDISVHIYMPAGIESPGMIAENVAKPAVTKKIEETDVAMSPKACALNLISGESVRLPFT
jgi:3-dehydrosphinganine reductase